MRNLPIIPRAAGNRRRAAIKTRILVMQTEEGEAKVTGFLRRTNAPPGEAVKVVFQRFWFLFCHSRCSAGAPDLPD